MSNQQRKFGWRRDIPNHNDPKYALHPEMLAEMPLPGRVDLENVMPSVENQGYLSDCVAFGLGACLEHMEILSIAKKNLQSPEYFTEGYQKLSKLYTYWFSRKMDGTTQIDQGTTIRSAIMASQFYGMCRDQLWTYDETKVLVAPDDHAYVEAQKHILVDAFRIDHTSEVEIRTCLAQGYPIAFGMSLGKSYMSPEVAQTGMVPELQPGEDIVGGHAQAIIGYNDTTALYKVRNSWGVTWGDHGHAWIHYDMIQGDMSADFWTLRPKNFV